MKKYKIFIYILTSIKLQCCCHEISYVLVFPPTSKCRFSATVAVPCEIAWSNNFKNRIAKMHKYRESFDEKI